MVEHHVEFYYVLLMTVNVTLSLIVMLAACLCCKKKVPKNDLLGLEGMVKLKNPDEVLVVTTVAKTESHGDLNISTLSTADSDKRASTAAHRSLPDIPVAETNGDTGSELYETVAEKMLLNAQNKQQTSPTPSLKKQTSVSQHSSISQADDVSSPYSRVKNSPHNYAKVRTTEHPYAQLNPPSTSAAAAAAAAVANAANSSATSQQSSTLNRSSQQSSDSVQNLSESPIHAEIPAASAIAGMISASQDLPYMTPPIANQHFSGDSQDSSKGYTSISVREPLANILAQQPTKILQRNPPLSRDVNDSHYATVSDDSDETYAAIEDPNLRHLQNTAADIYTSGSETYAQIQPMQGGNSIVVSVEINNTAQPSVITQHQQQQQQHFDSIASGIAQQAAAAAAPGPTAAPSTQNHRLSLEHATPIPPPVDSLRAQMHSRQASSSSNNSSSVGNLGSPKPEKRQANSPLPPTPKSNTSLQYHLHAATSSSNTSLTSGRNSVISVLEVTSVQEANEAIGSSEGAVEQEVGNNELSPQKKHKSLSPSKDIEGMYAKVMKKNKNSGNASNSQQNSPIMSRRHHDSSLGVSPLDSAAAQLLDAHAINLSASSSSGASRIRSNSYTAKDHGYETIPADSMRNANISTASSGGVLALENRKSDIYPNVLQKERQQLEHSSAFGTQLKAPAPANISVNVGNAVSKISSTSLGGGNKPTTPVEKYYETIASPPSANNSDPGYETLKINTDQELESEKKSDYDPNYEVLKSTTAQSDDGYAKVLEKKPNLSDTHDGYTKVKGEDEEEEGNIPGYSTIGEVKGGGATADANHNYASIAETKKLALKAEIENDDEDDVNTETEPDHYARINEARLPAAKEPSLSAASTPGRLTTEDLLSPRPQLVTSPSSMNSSSFFNTSSMASSSTTVTTSTSTMSSRQTPSSSQYESLTGSETDPNYESVCYLSGSAATENPYERLQTEYSDLQLSSSSSSLAVATQSASTPTKVAASNHSSTAEPVGVGKTVLPAKEVVGSSVGKSAVDVLVVDDYFQV